MDYAKLMLAAQMRREILKEMGIERIDQSPKIKSIANVGTYEERIQDLFQQIQDTAKMLP
jgi:hypothetical protein